MRILERLVKVANELDQAGHHRHADSLDKILERYAGYESSPPIAVPGGYLAIVLDEASHEALLSWWRETVQIPIHQKVYAHHTTLKYQPTQEELDSVQVDIPAKLEVTGWAADQDVQAVAVHIELPCANSIPHITIATSKGGRPVQSNALLQAGMTQVTGPILSGSVKYVAPSR